MCEKAKETQAGKVEWVEIGRDSAGRYSGEKAAEDFRKIEKVAIGLRDIPTIKAWRAERYAAGLPCGLKDFYVENGFCFACHGSGWTPGWTLSQYRSCSGCGGSGRTSDAG